MVETNGPWIESLRVRGYRGFTDLKVDGLGDVNLIFGDNNSGKTSFLEVVAISARPFQEDSWIQAQRQPAGAGYLLQLGASTLINAELDEVRWLFHRTGSSHGEEAIVIERTGAAGQAEIEASCKAARVPMDPDLVHLLTRKAARKTKDKTEGQELVEVWNLSISVAEHLHDGKGRELKAATLVFPSYLSFDRPPVPTINEIPVRVIAPTRVSQDLLARSWSGAVTAGFKQQVVALIQNFDRSVRDIDLIQSEGRRPVLTIDHSKMGRVPAKSFGDGMARALLFASEVAQARNGVLLIDEVETSIHYSALLEVFRWLQIACKKSNVQLFLTTHSLEAIDALIQTSDEQTDLKAIRLENNDGMVQATVFSEGELRELRLILGQEVRS